MKSFKNIYFKGIFRDYQKSVLENSARFLEDGKINIVAAPGSGKTILGLELIRRLGNPTIILSPTTTIKQQWIERFHDFFLDDSESIEDYASTDINDIKLINSITYQALHSIMNKVEVVAEDNEEPEAGEVITDHNLDLFSIIRKNNIKTICLDEAHHLQNEWQKALEKFIGGLAEDIKIISLTATPPYDAKTAEWQRYINVCGEIDEEIFVPELVKNQTLCPHQDYVYFNYPTEEEIKELEIYKRDAYFAVQEIINLPFIYHLSITINKNYKLDYDKLFTNTKEYIALLVLFKYANFKINHRLVKILITTNYLPEFNLEFGEIAIGFLLDSDLYNEEEKNEIIQILKKYNLYSKNIVSLNLNDKLKRKIISSIGKLDSIKK